MGAQPHRRIHARARHRRFPKNARGADYPGDALATFDAQGDALDVRIDATSPEQRDALKDVVARHLDRFAFREAPLHFDWRNL